ncbi:FemAB family protein [Flavobacterium sp. 9AF]|uniref:FemAB family protein n=1 Tax=Flavobacterium sp. 9AF TaxID=2653142 RepID=UPI0012F2EC1F|nr:FemAB family protein [Flavobacterium sp. 9AF]VXB68182.1 FemAB family protein [Flavobacterium sp. 9AF]
MKTYQVKKYTTDYYLKWNEFVAQAKNATFLFHRDYMEYHSDRFEDFSILIFDEKDNLKAILPGNRVGNAIYSHQGLTYGGLVLYKNLKFAEVKLIFEMLFSFLKENNFVKLIYKPINSYYQSLPSEEYLFILKQWEATLVKRELNLCIPFYKDYKISKSKLKHYKRNEKLDLKIKKETDFSLFWNQVLIPRLETKHSVKPVHTLDEIIYLARKFPENIIQYNAYYNNQIVAGITLFITKTGIKSQYGATTDAGERIRALDFLYFKLIELYKDSCDFFDMGTCTENNELGFNPGLLNQKEELGCSLYNQDTYSITL